MSIRKEIKESQEFKQPTMCYEKGGITFVPHYSKVGHYAYPGITKGEVGFSAEQLEAMGAVLTTRHLFRAMYF